MANLKVTVTLTPNEIAELVGSLYSKQADLKAGRYGRTNKAEGISIPKWIKDVRALQDKLNRSLGGK